MLDPFVDGRGGGGGGGGGAIGFAPERAGEPAARYRARLCLGAEGAAASDASISAGPPGARLTAAATRTNGNPTVGSNNVTAQHLRLCRRHGLSRHAEHGIRLRARRRRHQLGAGQRARQRPQRCLPGRRLWHHAIRAGLSRRRARLRQSLVHDQPHRRSATSSPRTSTARATARGSKAAIASPCCRRLGVTPYARVAGAGLPHAELQRDRSDRRRLRAFLHRHERDRHPQRARRALRRSARSSAACRSFCARRVAWAHDWVSNPSLGAVFQSLPGRELHRQRRADAAELGAHLRRRRTVPHAATGRCSPSSTASSPPARRPTPAPARCAIRGDRRRVAK